MDTRQNNNVRQLDSLKPLEVRVLRQWYHGDAARAFSRGTEIPGAKRFYLAEGNYSRRKTADLIESLKDLSERGRHNSPAARGLAREIARRRRGQYSGVPTGPDNGPEAA